MPLDVPKPYSKESQVGTSKLSVTSKARRSAGGMKRGRKARDSQAAGLFKHIVCADDCLVGSQGGCEPPLDAAHVVPAQTLRKLGLDHLVYDPLNGVAICRRHHSRHDLCVEKIPRHVLPARCFAWASAHGLTEHLERHWPVAA